MQSAVHTGTGIESDQSCKPCFEQMVRLHDIPEPRSLALPRNQQAMPRAIIGQHEVATGLRRTILQYVQTA